MNGLNKMLILGEVVGNIIDKDTSIITLSVLDNHTETMQIFVGKAVEVKKGSALYIDAKIKSGKLIADNISNLLPTGNITLYSRYK